MQGSRMQLKVGLAAALAACAVAALAPGTAAAATHIRYVSKSKTIQHQHEGTKNFSCPNGFELIGGGGSTNGAQQGPFTELGLLSSGQRWHLQADNFLVSDSINLKSVAICVSGGLANAAHLVDPGITTSVQPHQQSPAIVAACPGQQKVVGGGVLTGNAGYGNRLLNTSVPDDTADDTDLKPDDQWLGYIDNFTTGPMNLEGQATCVRGRQRSHLRYKIHTRSLSGSQGSVKATCPHGSKVIGGGAYSSAGYGQSRISASKPADGRDRRHRADDAWKVTQSNLSGGSINNIEADAICYKK